MSHEIVEIVGSNETIIVKVGLVENMVQLLFCEVFSEILRNFLELVDADFSLNNLICTDLLTSKDFQILSTSSLLSLSPNLAVASLKNSAKSIPPD